MVPSGGGGKKFIKETTRLINLWTDDSLLENIALKAIERPKGIAKISVKFKELMQKGNVNGALKLLTNERSNGILPLTEETLSQLEIKHPDNRDDSADVPLNGPIKEIYPIDFDAIDEEMVLKAASINKGGSGLSGLDSDGWRRILTSN